MQAGSPPPYTSNNPHVAGPYQTPHPLNGARIVGPLSPPPRSPYGPTPIGLYPEGVGILPYYNPEAFHTQELMAEASRRARRRFLEAFMWAALIWCVIGVTTSATVAELRAARR
ncbi:RNA recognition domain-containing protein [Ceratobasidium theobromae]|uniref:RNA recognition domain-containing protein n=1 Tax=Ceratobasidium theobromae TaxID=1582974 RepID=A0A5N5QV44_9AGAM|nr:RNA recognition domain-containing protein [Ceratobasidium theobromae]